MNNRTFKFHILDPILNLQDSASGDPFYKNAIDFLYPYLPDYKM